MKIMARRDPAVAGIEASAREDKLVGHEGVCRMALSEQDARLVVVMANPDHRCCIARALGSRKAPRCREIRLGFGHSGDIAAFLFSRRVGPAVAAWKLSIRSRAS